MSAMRNILAIMLTAVLLCVTGLWPLHAAGQLISITTASDLAFPVAQTPPGYIPQPAKTQAITTAMLQPVIGKAMLEKFQKSGYIAGYHGWMDATDPSHAAFATYDLFGFNTINGAQIARLAYQTLVQGLQSQIPDPALPKSAVIWTDNTGTFGADNQPYAVAEILFRVANVVGDVTGFADGNDQTATDLALQQATGITVACVHWLTTLRTTSHQTIVPFAPLALLLPAQRRRKH